MERDYAKLIKALREGAEYAEKLCAHETAKGQSNAADAIEELLAKDTNAPNKWISVEERLPEKHVEVLICTEDYGKNELGFANTAVWDGSEWIETWNRKEFIPYVSHWMPLPAPPKGVE